MNELLNHDSIVELVQSTTRTLFETMMSGTVTNLTAYLTSTVEDHEESVFCLIGFSGDFVGSGSLHCSGTCAARLASALLMTEFEKVDDEVLDAVAEVANMIVGNFKTSIEDKLGEVGISTPTVIFGRQYAARNFGASEWTVVPFDFEGHTFDVRVSLQPNKQIRKLLKKQSDNQIPASYQSRPERRPLHPS